MLSTALNTSVSLLLKGVVGWALEEES
jgi:hypothetical protein